MAHPPFGWWNKDHPAKLRQSRDLLDRFNYSAASGRILTVVLGRSRYFAEAVLRFCPAEDLKREASELLCHIKDASDKYLPR